MHKMNMIFAAALAFSACAAAAQPDFIGGPLQCAAYDGVGNDLLTAGLGKSGL